jgi:hypothetical protein
MDERRVAQLRRIVPLLGVLLVAGIIYDAAVFYTRRKDALQAEQQQAALEARHEQRTIDSLDGDGLKIIAFYATPGVISRGGHTELCYGVTGAKTVRIEPPVGDVWPALSRCLQTSPGKDTEYKITAEDGAGHSATQTLPIKVR